MKKRNRRGLPFPDGCFSEEGGRTRVLFECSDPALAGSAEYFLRESGYDVAVCWGPTAGERAGPCPLIAEGRCSLVDAADVVVQSFRLSERESFPILRSMRERRPDKAVCVEVPEPSRWKYGHDLDGCTVLDLPMTPARLVEAVEGISGGPVRKTPSRAPST